MSHSYKHTPIFSVCVCRSAKRFKQQENRRRRHKENQILQSYKEATIRLDYLRTIKKDMPHYKEYGNEWSSPRDGRSWYDDPRCTVCKYGHHWLGTISYYHKRIVLDCYCNQRDINLHMSK